MYAHQLQMTKCGPRQRLEQNKITFYISAASLHWQAVVQMQTHQIALRALISLCRYIERFSHRVNVCICIKIQQLDFFNRNPHC